MKDNREVGSRGSRGGTMVFLTAEFALAVVMLVQIAVGLRLSRPELPSDAAINTSEVLTAAVTVSGERYRTPDQRLDFFRGLEERLEATPGISFASISNVLPLGGGRERQIEVAGREPVDPPRRVLTVGIGPDYFQTLRLAMLRGREFAQHDGSPGQAQWRPTSDSSHVLVPRSSTRSFYVPYRTMLPNTGILLARTTGDAESIVPAVRAALLDLDANVPLYRARTMGGVVDDGGWNARVSNVLINVLAFIAVTLATLGLYAVTADAVYRRTPELGLRMALVAQKWHLTRLILERTAAQAGVGFVVGLACTAVWARLFWTGSERELMSAEPLAMVAAVVVVLTLAASLLPVFRATRINPVTALRHE